MLLSVTKKGNKNACCRKDRMQTLAFSEDLTQNVECPMESIRKLLDRQLLDMRKLLVYRKTIFVCAGLIFHNESMHF